MGVYLDSGPELTWSLPELKAHPAPCVHPFEQHPERSGRLIHISHAWQSGVCSVLFQVHLLQINKLYSFSHGKKDVMVAPSLLSIRRNNLKAEVLNSHMFLSGCKIWVEKHETYIKPWSEGLWVMHSNQASEPSVRRLTLSKALTGRETDPWTEKPKHTSTHPNCPFLIASKSRTAYRIHPSNTKSMTYDLFSTSWESEALEESLNAGTSKITKHSKNHDPLE